LYKSTYEKLAIGYDFGPIEQDLFDALTEIIIVDNNATAINPIDR